MDVVGTTLSVTHTLSSALRRPELKHILSIYGYESKLEELQNTVNKIKNVLLNAEAKQQLSYVVQLWIENLKDVVFEADDLLDEFITLVEQKQHIKADGTISKKMRLFLSRSNPLVLAYKMSKEVEKIGKNLSSFADKISSMMEFSLEPIKNRNRETCSYVDVVDIVGREADLEHIVGKLLDYDVQSDLSFLPIVGMGGLGKTSLAQLVYNDKRVESAFSLRLWHCVSDQDQKQLNIADILRKILALIINKIHEGSSEQIVQKLQEILSDKKYLLVLDDVWTESPTQWNDLATLLNVGQRGSWIIVTTRSKETAKFIGYDSMYQLQGLANEKSWILFEKIAFGSEHSNLHDDELVEIGQKIVEACGGVPLALRVAGSLVYGQDKRKWQLVQEVGVANMGNDNGITHILKLSYQHLPFSIKNCFSYCAVFPKDYRMRKDLLISLWIAHNYIIPYEGQSIEEAGEAHFLILLNRCFFQDIQKDDETGKVCSVKIHDLLHAVAQGVSCKEILAETTISGNPDKNVRHLSISSNTKYENFPLCKSHVRSYLNTYEYDYQLLNVNNFFVETLVESCKYLRVLKLVGLEDQCLSEPIGKLFHLRYLDLSNNLKLLVLPKSITKLCNLETLILHKCFYLYELPKDLSRLVKLRVLDISGCERLEYMPRGMNKLTYLTRLSDFIVGDAESCSSNWTKWFLGLEELKDINNIRDDLRIMILWPKEYKNFAKEGWRRREFYLRDKKHLNHIDILYDEGYYNSILLDYDEAFKLMEDMHPPSSLHVCKVKHYHGKSMPEWTSHLPNLVVLTLSKCYVLEYLETFENVGESFLPSLQKLELEDLPKLKGWRRREVIGVDDNNSQLHLQLCLPRLRRLEINNCPELTCFPLCPRLEMLSLNTFSERLRGIIKTERDDRKSKEMIVLESPKFTEVKTDDVVWLNSLPIEAFQSLEILKIDLDCKVKKLGEAEKVFRGCSSSLRILSCKSCFNLRSVVDGGLEHLMALEILEIDSGDGLTLSEEIMGKDNGSGGSSCLLSIFLPSLHTLKLKHLSKMMNLPNWMQFLPALQTLHIEHCLGLKEMPNWMPNLTSLKQLHVQYCSKSLKRRCEQDPEGEDWPYIQHIPNIQFINCSYEYSCNEEYSDEEHSVEEYSDEDY